MSKLLCINTVTSRENPTDLGDIIGTFPDSHEFSPAEINGFDIYSLNFSEDEINNYMNNIVEQQDLIYPQPNHNKYIFKVSNPTGVTLTDIISMRVEF